MPLISRALTVSGGGCTKPCNLKVPVGTLVSDLMPQFFDKKDSTVKIISGGPMMGFSMPTEAFPIVKGTSGITFLTEEETFLKDESQCISCGKCISACPMHLSPVLMSKELEAQNIASARKFGLMDCIECGCCAYVCPAGIRLVQRFRMGKSIVRTQMAQERAKAEAAKKAADSNKPNGDSK